LQKPRSFAAHAAGIAIGVHALLVAVLFLWMRPLSLAVAENAGVEISGMSWEVEPAAKAEQSTQPLSDTGHVTSSKTVAAKRDEIKLPTKNEDTASANLDAGANSSSAVTKAGPPPDEIQKYLLGIRNRLSNAIQITAPAGFGATTLILRVAITPSGTVAHSEIQKTSGNPEVDTQVLRAFQSILPLPAFPSDWNEKGSFLSTLTVRLPIEIRPRR
jgi:TonB family protein